ncbi:DUF317 domain-containing protein [Streptomyces sp. NPDC059881]|uniref:DUF317 domain-containing protein n=1 Tax=Streptomyces sp. NPDC059881 TaxID=3346986 RepID=UPI0036521784
MNVARVSAPRGCRRASFLTPEGLGGVRHRYATSGSGELAWRAWGGYPSEPHRTARFSFGTPTTLVAAFTASLISTERLQRTVQDVPAHSRRALYVAPRQASNSTAPHPSPRRLPSRPPATRDELLRSLSQGALFQPLGVALSAVTGRWPFR